MMSCPYSRETSPPVSGVGAGHPGSWQGGTCNLPWSLLRSTLAGSRSGHWSHCWCHWSLHVVTVVVWAGAQSVPDWDAGTSQQQHCHQPAQRPSQAGCCGLVVAHRGTLASTPPVVTHATTPRRHTAAWLLAPGSPAPASLTTEGLQCVLHRGSVDTRDGAEQSPRLPCPELPRCSQAVESSGQPGSSRTQQRPAWTGSVWGECRRGAASTCSSSPAPAAGPAGGAAGGGGGAAAGGRGLRCSAPRLPRRWNDNNLTIT